MGGIQPKRELTEMNERDIARAKSKLRGAKVSRVSCHLMSNKADDKFTVTHRKSSRLHTVQSITLMPAEKIFFALNGKDGQADRRVSICQYFEEFHGSTVTKPRLPCIQVSFLFRFFWNVWTRADNQYGKKAYVPLEFVELTEWNSLPPLKLSPDQTAE
jgi:eukaryotic translation initiation factor 2C